METTGAMAFGVAQWAHGTIEEPIAPDWKIGCVLNRCPRLLETLVHARPICQVLAQPAHSIGAHADRVGGAGRAGTILAQPALRTEVTSVTCGSCGAVSPAGKRFCADCGSPLATYAGIEAERRQLSVLFCDLVGSTALSEHLDPEDLREVIREYQRAAVASIEAYGGYVAQYLGDGLLAYFGYPSAHEDDAARAVRAGLAIVASIEEVERRVRGQYAVTLAVRIGIHTGRVVVGQMGGGERLERLAIGETPNIAARLQSLADPGQVVLGESTYRLVAGLFDCRDLGRRTLKGIAEPMTMYEAVAETGVRSRFELAAAEGLAPMVGRGHELAAVRNFWDEVQHGKGHVVLIDGEIGVGKSRFVAAAKPDLAETLHARLECACSPYAHNTALYPVVDLLTRLIGLQRDERPDEQLAKIERFFAGSRSLPANTPLLVADLLSVPLPSEVARLPAPGVRRELVLEVLVTWLVHSAPQLPRVLVVEDLHWADPSTLELLGRLVDRVDNASLLCLFTFRSEFVPSWGLRPYVSRLYLSPLGPDHIASLVSRVAGGRALPASVLRKIIERTDGVPLFVEELTRTLIESHQLREVEGRFELVDDSSEVEIPSTLQGALMARLDRLGAAREVAQIASVLGREFSLRLLLTVSGMDSETLSPLIDRLVRADLLNVTQAGVDAGFAFRHALIQETAHESLLRSARQRYHLAAARILESEFPEVARVQPELLARHLAEAREYDAAVKYWELAGKSAMERSALEEALTHFRSGLKYLPQLGTVGRSAEVSLQLGLSMALASQRGFSAPGVDEAFRRALDLSSEIGNVRELFPAVYGLWLYDFIGGRVADAGRWSDQLLAIAERSADRLFLVEGKYVSAVSLLYQGAHPARVATLVEEALSLYDPSFHRSMPGLSDPLASYRGILAMAYWLTGAYEQALELGAKAATIAEAGGHPYTQAYVFAFEALMLDLMGRHADALVAARRSVAISEANGFAFWGAWARCAAAGLAEPAARVHVLPAALDDYRAQGFALQRPHFLLRLAAAHQDLGAPSEALPALDEAMSTARSTGELFLVPELHRLKAEVLWGLDSHLSDAVSASLQLAIDVARRQGSRVFEFRATISLARYLLAHSDGDAPARLLMPLLWSFPITSSMPEVEEARALVARNPLPGSV